MQQIKERLAYLKGLADGLNVGDNTPEGRVLVGIMDVLSEVASEMDRLTARSEQLEEYIEAIDDDLTDLESDLFDEYDEDLDVDVEFEEEEDDDDLAIEYLEMNCPNCNETVFVDADVFENDEVVEVLCPECKETVLVNDDESDEFLGD
ncbi:hypothetical protein OS242_15995 [Tumebacillus sp. DT12]|uniref:AraC family transcriptional regulator n=1 Tax=Tumebacillus lacus TaxID=2995335 RepID=A0ABT3X3J4_9BACL|nr:CD1247 N-terminal domain-containing protein [Tumebacillus lacus]MCX7571453.1 hypothetical protein [Tumebacillus lacus]